MPVVDIDGVNLFYREAGRGRPCLVMHGGLGYDHSYLAPGLDILGDTLRLTYYDHRCNGRSGRPPIDTLSFEQLADDADALRASLGHQRISILAHSITGSAVALEYALRHPHRLDRLILVCAAPGFNPADPAFGARLANKGMTAEMAEAFACAGTSDASLARYVELAGPLYHHAFDRERYLRQIGNIAYSAAAMARSFELAAAWTITPRLAAIAAPTLLIAGASDPFATPEDARTLQRSIPAATVTVLAKSGHFPWVEQPEGFAATVVAWLGRHDANPTP